jgi:hypothetical protein
MSQSCRKETLPSSNGSFDFFHVGNVVKQVAIKIERHPNLGMPHHCLQVLGRSPQTFDEQLKMHGTRIAVPR